MSFENPVANVDHVDVLFHDDVAGKDPVVYPIAQATLGRRGVWPCRPVDVAGKIVSLSADNLTERPIMDAPHHFDEWGAIANLESDIQAELTFHALADFDHFQRARNIHSNGLFEIDVLACGHDGFQMPKMVVGRSGNYDGVQFLGRSDLLIRVGAGEELRSVDRGVTFGLLDFI